MQSNNRYIWIDYIRVFATFCVVLLHVAAPLLLKYNELPELPWMTANLYNSSVRMCVPLFFMISGCLLLEKNEPVNTFFRKRINKVLIPLLTWSIFYTFLKAHDEDSPISLHSFYSIVFAPAYDHLWFLYAIIGVYLFVPILRIIVNQSNNKILYYYVALWFFAASIVPAGEKITGLKNWIDLRSISGFAGYLVLGLLLSKIKTTKGMLAASGILYFTCVVITATGTTFLVIHNGGKFSDYFYDYLSPNVVILSAATFMLLKHYAVKIDERAGHRFTSMIHSISSASFGIYLIHPVFISRISHFAGFQDHVILSIPLAAVAIFLLSYASILIFQKVPILNKISN
jgi:surface polysaccharide O-acyltransferase-like enzyme